MKKHPCLLGTTTAGLSLLLLAPVAAQADVKIETLTHYSDVTGIAAHDSDTTDYIQGDKKREENLRKFTGSVLGAWQKFRGEDKGSLGVDIYLVGENKHFDVDPAKKTYSEDKIYDPAQPKEPPSGGADTHPQPQQQQDNDTKVTKNELTVKDTGNTKNLNGFDAHEYLISWDFETVNTKNGNKGKSLMTTDLWTSTDSKLAKARAEEAAYEKAYLKLMQIQMPMRADDEKLFGFGSGTIVINGQQEKDFFAKLHSIKGLPVSTDVTWEAGGTDANGKNTNSDSSQQSGQPQTLDSALGSVFGGSKSDDSKNPPAKKADDGMTTLFSSHIEVKSVDTSAVDASQFQVPSDYKVDD